MEPGWSCSAEPAIGDQAARVTFTLVEQSQPGKGHTHMAPADHQDPAPPPGPGEPAPAPEGEADMFHFGVHTAAQPGSYSFPVEQRYSDGKKVLWDGDAASSKPAPVVNVEAAPPAA